MKNRSPDEVRVLDSDGYKRRAACLCIRDVNASSNSRNNVGVTFAQQHQPKEILLISSTKKPDVWLVPGGGVDPNEDIAVAATRESFEEAGVKGRLDGFVGVFETSKGTLTRTHVFKLVVEEMAEAWLESTRKRKWFPLEEARQLLQAIRPAQKEYLDKYVWQIRTNFDNRPALIAPTTGARDNSERNNETQTTRFFESWKSRSAQEVQSSVC